jgi:hypothetical protein
MKNMEIDEVKYSLLRHSSDLDENSGARRDNDVVYEPRRGMLGLLRSYGSMVVWFSLLLSFAINIFQYATSTQPGATTTTPYGVLAYSR